MGEIADAMIAGECCSICGQYFLDEEKTKKLAKKSNNVILYEHGYPVACDECWESGCGYGKALAPTL